MFFRTVGILATIVGVLIMAAGAVLFVRSLPEVGRYLKIRSM
jgi:ascorbate-specific PTS system EIIC-type component UlaA